MKRDKDWLITLLKSHGVDVYSIPDLRVVDEETLILNLHRNRVKLPEGFFKDLARILGLPFIDKGLVQARRDLAMMMPYLTLKENLTVPLEVSADRIKVATSNPLNKGFFRLIGEIFKGRLVEVWVASIETVDETIEDGYRELHKDRALRDLIYRRPDESAYVVLYPWQRYLIIGSSIVFLFLFIINYPASFILLFSSINILYFIVNPVKIYISLRGLLGPHRTVTVSGEEVKSLEDKRLPVYTVFIPVYREAGVLQHILQNIYRMDYPKDRLDVKILMEERDSETLTEAARLGLLGESEATIESMTKEEYKDFLRTFDPVIIPYTEITTKPRACNFGLLRAKGEYCVIYDAEDDPEPDQLKKAVAAFSIVPENCVCLQARLNYYNARQNLLTRWFSLEYSYWYDYYLEGLDRVGAPLPLGGTSNHFKTKILRELGGWDPYNMTEDADLGVRISRAGYKTAMLDSYTYEEAASRLRSWIRQRSRWYKGYVQTYLVHMRRPRQLLREMGWKQFFYFQLTFGGNIFLPLINPLLWLVTLLTLLIPGIFQFLFFYPVVYFCIFNLAVGNTVYILLHLGPYILKKNYTSIPLALIIPIYWVLISVGAWRGTMQLITKPFYWEKTEHGISRIHGKV
ncbi:glycosyltransferase [Candidatus Bathyarchaeota archaeon]|nr:glycosyltransferase [Candidatus Bathyarchaeota archaeon]